MHTEALQTSFALALYELLPATSYTTRNIYTVIWIYITMAQCLCLTHSLPALKLKLGCYFPSCTVVVCESVYVCVRVTGSIRTLSAELIGSNEFLCWGGGQWRGLWGSCLAASPKSTPLRGFISTTFHCPTERRVHMCICVCIWRCAAAVCYLIWCTDEK